MIAQAAVRFQALVVPARSIHVRRVLSKTKRVGYATLEWTQNFPPEVHTFAQMPYIAARHFKNPNVEHKAAEFLPPTKRAFFPK